MKNLDIVLCLSVLLGFVLFLDCWSIPSHPDEGLQMLLPQSDEINAWARNLGFEEYKGDDLFFYINGGAEIYHEYGFERVIVQDYQSQSGKSVSLEIYQMSSPESAFGIYTFKSEGKGQELALGHDCKLQDYYLNFWKGQYLVTLTGFDSDKETIEGIRAIATAVDRKLHTSPEPQKPRLCALLPPKNLDAQSIKYFRGHLGLVNSYPFSNKNIFNIREGVRGAYADRYEIYILAYRDDKEQDEAFTRAKEHLKEETKYEILQAGEEHIAMRDPNGTLLMIQPFRRFIFIVLGSKKPQESFQILDALKEYLRTQSEENR